jgi:hypothetical protein
LVDGKPFIAMNSSEPKVAQGLGLDGIPPVNIEKKE